MKVVTFFRIWLSAGEKVNRKMGFFFVFRILIHEALFPLFGRSVENDLGKT